jgi:hypothetical protein
MVTTTPQYVRKVGSGAGEVEEWKAILKIMPESGVMMCNKPGRDWDNINKKLLRPGSEIAEFLAQDDELEPVTKPSGRNNPAGRVLEHQAESGTVQVVIGG